MAPTIEQQFGSFFRRISLVTLVDLWRWLLFFFSLVFFLLIIIIAAYSVAWPSFELRFISIKWTQKTDGREAAAAAITEKKEDEFSSLKANCNFLPLLCVCGKMNTDDVLVASYEHFSNLANNNNCACSVSRGGGGGHLYWYELHNRPTPTSGRGPHSFPNSLRIRNSSLTDALSRYPTGFCMWLRRSTQLDMGQWKLHSI